ncbi:hypothetical protein QL996_02190 [Planococcus sp. APC 4015]|nr:hypothetical protein [Planococcus sp. APC 4015]
MGLFQQRPEEPTEWAGIPSDPARAETAAERLAEGAPIRAGDGLFTDGATVESVVIPVSPAVGTAEPGSPDEAR